MKKVLLAAMVALSALAVTVTEAEAKRMGGGSSVGKQSQGISRSTPPAQQQGNQMSNANQAAPAAAPGAAAAGAAAKPASPWRNILGGALLGLGLGALLSHLGLGGAMANIIATVLMVGLLALAIMFIVRMVRRKNHAQAEPAFAGGYSASRTPEIGSRLQPQAQPAAFKDESYQSGSTAPVSAGPVASEARATQVPADFDVPGFLRSAKTYFIRLQAAWDSADVNDLREFTTPEMFAELKMQLQERGASANHTDVVTLDAELLALETVAGEYMASVRFSGMIKEAEGAPTEPFTEVWNLIKPVSGQGGWVLAGIQQLS